MSGWTRIAPLFMSSIARGYSPAEAHDPCSRIWRVTTFCSGRVTSGEMLPTRMTEPPLRTLSIAAATVSFFPTASTAIPTPVPSVRCCTCPNISGPAGNAHDLAVIAQIYFTSATGSTLPTRDRRVKCNAVPLRQTFHIVSEGHNCSRRLMAHNDGWNAPPGRAIVAVNIAAADTAGRDAHKNFTRTRLRHRE